MKERREALEGCYEEQRARRRRIIHRMRSRAKHHSAVAKERADERRLRRTRNELKLKDRLDNVERIRRVGEVARLRLLRKIEDEDRRSEDIKEERRWLIDQRKRISHEAFLRRSRMEEAIHQMRITNKVDANLAALIEGRGPPEADEEGST